MIAIEKLRQVTDVYFHKACPDGTAAAMMCAAAFHHLGMRPKFTSIQYGTDEMEKLEPRPGQLFVDITPPKARWEEWKSVSPIVLDHHETAEHVVKGLDGVYATNEAHSGAKIAFEEVLMSVVSPTEIHLMYWEKLAQLAMIRDTWKKDHADWRKSGAIAHSLLFEGSKSIVDMVLDRGIVSLDLDYLLSLGEKINQTNDRRMEKLANGAHHEVFHAGGIEYKSSFFNCTEKLVSEVANYLIEKGSDISVGYFWVEEDGQNRVVVSIRSNGRISASKVATMLGGGGHERAAGFRLPYGDQVSPSNIYRTVANVISEVMKT